MKFFKTKRKEVKKEVTKGVRNAVNALTFDLDRGPFGTLNLSKLMIKPNANSDSTIELSGHTIRIKTSEGNTGKIRVGLVCNESGTSCKDVQTLLRYGDIEWKQIPISWTLSKVLLPESTWSNVWIWKSTDLGAITEADEKLWVIWKTRLEWDLTVTWTTKLNWDLTVTWITKLDWDLTVGDNIELSWDVLRIKTDTGKLKVHEICDENGANCKRISELYTWNWGVVYWWGGDGYWKVVWNWALTTSWNYNMNLNQSLSVANDLTVNDWNIIVGKNDWKVNVSQICDKDGSNCRTVSDIVTGWSIYWGINGNNLKVSKWDYGLQLSTNSEFWQSYSFEIKNPETENTIVSKLEIDSNWVNVKYWWLIVDRGWVKVKNAGLTVTWATTLNNDLTVDGTTIANSGVRITAGWLTVTWAAELNNGLTVHNGLTATADGAITFRGTYINLAGANYIKLDGTKNFMGGDVNITGTTTITGWLNVNGGIDITTGSLRIMANKDSGFQISKKQNLNIYSPIFRVDTISDTYNIGVIWDTYIEWDTTIQWTTNLYWDTVIAWWNTTIGWSNITIDTNWWDIIIDWNTTTIRWDTTVKNKLYVGNDNNNCYNNNCLASDTSLDEIGQIRFVPKTFNNQKQISDVKPCDRSIEWTLVYWRDKNLRSNSVDYDPRLSICMCGLRELADPVCGWINIAEKNYYNW